MCVLVFLTTFFSETLLILIRIHPDVIINVRRSSCTVPIIHVRFEGNLNFLDRFPKNTHIKFHENPSCGIELLRAEPDRHDEANCRFSKLLPKIDAAPPPCPLVSS
jgi:hypothetical protein